MDNITMLKTHFKSIQSLSFISKYFCKDVVSLLSDHRRMILQDNDCTEKCLCPRYIVSMTQDSPSSQECHVATSEGNNSCYIYHLTGYFYYPLFTYSNCYYVSVNILSSLSNTYYHKSLVCIPFRYF